MRTKEQVTQDIRLTMRGLYDVQKLRISVGNRLVVQWKEKLGINTKEKEDGADKDAQDILKQLRDNYAKLTDGVVKFPTSAEAYKGDGVISNVAELRLVDSYMHLEKAEDRMQQILTGFVQQHPLWTTYLQKVKGCGPMMAAVILSEIDIALAKYPSSLHRLCGLDCGPDGRGRSRRKEHLEEREYVDKNGEKKTKMGITFKPVLKTKLRGVLAASFLKTAPDGRYAVAYRDHIHRLKHHSVYGEANDEQRIKEMEEKGESYSPKAHRHNMAMRYITKLFLDDLYVVWRRLEGLEVFETYAVKKLGYAPHADYPKAC